MFGTGKMCAECEQAVFVVEILRKQDFFRDVRLLGSLNNQEIAIGFGPI